MDMETIAQAQSALQKAVSALQESLTRAVQDQEPQQLRRLHHGKKMLSEREAAEFCGMKPENFRRIPENERPPFVRLTPRRRLYPIEDLENWLAKLPRVNR
jgi:predicted DNA-binding transcriptional regulator AlpA